LPAADDERPFEGHLGGVALQQTRFEDLDAGLALGLGRVHRHVGAVDERLKVGLAGCCGHPHTGADVGDPAADAHGGRDRLDDAQRDVLGFFRCPADSAAQHDGELIPAQPCAQVPGAGGPEKPRPDLTEQIVTRPVAENVVDALEVVQVDEQHGGVG